MNILALDLGTTTGWALGLRDGKVRSGSECFAAKRNDGPGQRWLKFRAFLGRTANEVGELQVVYFEDVRRHGLGQVLAAHAYGGFRSHLEMWCELRHIRLVPVGVGVIKKHWTGSGVAKKREMIDEAVRRGYRPVDDNHADALAILALARDLEAGKVKLAPKAKKKPSKKAGKAAPIATTQPQTALFAEAQP